MNGPGTITWEEFLENAERFLVVSNRISDGWELRGNKVYNFTLLYISNFLLQYRIYNMQIGWYTNILSMYHS